VCSVPSPLACGTLLGTTGIEFFTLFLYAGAGVFGSLTVWELPAYFFPLDNDLLSMELPASFK
jgi:hypothetical protein